MNKIIKDKIIDGKMIIRGIANQTHGALTNEASRVSDSLHSVLFHQQGFSANKNELKIGIVFIAAIVKSTFRMNAANP